MVSSFNYFTEFHDFSMIIQGFFKFHDFSMHGTFLVIFQISMISRACGNPELGYFCVVNETFKVPAKMHLKRTSA